MNYMGIPDPVKTPTEALMSLLETFVQIITFSAVILFAATFFVVIWLCLSEPKHPKF